MRARTSVVTVMVTAGVTAAALAGALGGSAAGRLSRPDLVIRSVLAPFPPGTLPGGEMSVRSRVANLGGARASVSEVAYFLSSKPTLRPGYVRLVGVQRISALRGGAAALGGADVTVPLQTRPGIYYLVACLDAAHPGPRANATNSCKALGHPIAIQDGANDPPYGLRSSVAGGPPAGYKQYFPARDQISDASTCPLSAHGQSFTGCRWVKTDRFTKTTVRGLFYCPSSNPYPFIVALGFDPLWHDLSSFGLAQASVGAVSGTLYKYTGSEPELYAYSYVGSGTHDGYVSMVENTRGEIGREGQIEYLCSDYRANSYLP
jgi:hypothetical protein